MDTEQWTLAGSAALLGALAKSGVDLILGRKKGQSDERAQLSKDNQDLINRLIQESNNCNKRFADCEKRHYELTTTVVELTSRVIGLESATRAQEGLGPK